MQLEGKRALITGAGSGIGRALAIKASHLGMTVALCGRRAGALNATLTQMAPGKGHLRLRGDITDPAVRRGLRNYLSRHWGGLDVLVNNAGVVAVGPLAHATDEELERVMTTNIIAPLALTRDMVPLLRRSAPSRIVNIGSVFGDIAYPLVAAYSASKFALRGMSIALRRELEPYGIGVTYAAPRATKTDASPAFDPLVEPMQMRVDDPTVVASQIWRAVVQDLDSVYAKGPERLFVLVQRLAPKIVDRAIAAQMTDPRIRDYLGRSDEAARTRTGGHQDDALAAPGTRSTNSTGMPRRVQAPTAQLHGSDARRCRAAQDPSGFVYQVDGEQIEVSAETESSGRQRNGG
jgi:NAD(P)-dependent dehydrogenase (short-subunit alcohol dehydrogenase family)